MKTFKNRKRSMRKRKERKSRKFSGGTGWGWPYSAEQNYWEEGVLQHHPHLLLTPEQSYSPFYNFYPRFNQTGGMDPILYSNKIRTNIIPYF